MQEKIENGKAHIKSGFGLNTMYNDTFKERKKGFKAIYEYIIILFYILKKFLYKIKKINKVYLIL
jgi:hypothetical protein